MKQKPDTLATFKLFQCYVNTQFNVNIKAFRLDFGGEFMSFTKYLNEIGIMNMLTSPHTFHENGTVERKYMQIMKMGLILLAHTSLPTDF